MAHVATERHWFFVLAAVRDTNVVVAVRALHHGNVVNSKSTPDTGFKINPGTGADSGTGLTRSRHQTFVSKAQS
jgi:hypothetical protein